MFGDVLCENQVKQSCQGQSEALKVLSSLNPLVLHHQEMGDVLGLNAFGKLHLTGTWTNDEWQEDALLLSLRLKHLPPQSLSTKHWLYLVRLTGAPLKLEWT